MFESLLRSAQRFSAHATVHTAKAATIRKESKKKIQILPSFFSTIFLFDSRTNEDDETIYILVEMELI